MDDDQIDPVVPEEVADEEELDEDGLPIKKPPVDPDEEESGANEEE